MTARRTFLVGCALSLGVLASARAEGDLVTKKWTVKGVERTALLHAPAAALLTSTPVVFAFHGHGGTARSAANKFRLHALWPQAIVVYPQGLPTPGARTDPEGKRAGWQKTAGDQGDRDLEFVDAMLETLGKDWKVDVRRVYAMGHSNGGGFTYLLWATRAEKFAAFAPSSAGAGGAARRRDELVPRPILHLAGRKDPIVPFEGQLRTLRLVRDLNGCEAEGQAWGDATLYRSSKGAPVVELVHPGGHEFYEGGGALVVRFFREQESLVAKMGAVR